MEARPHGSSVIRGALCVIALSSVLGHRSEAGSAFCRNDDPGCVVPGGVECSLENCRPPYLCEGDDCVRKEQVCPEAYQLPNDLCEPYQYCVVALNGLGLCELYACEYDVDCEALSQAPDGTEDPQPMCCELYGWSLVCLPCRLIGEDDLDAFRVIKD